MKIQIVAIHYPVASGRYIARAFRRLGHDVRTVGYSTGASIWGMQVDPRHIWRPNAPADAVFVDWKPDVIIIADSAIQYHNFTHDDVPHVVWGVDNHVRNYRQPGVCHYFLGHHDGPTQPVAHEDESWLPCAYDPEAFGRDTLPWQRPIHVGMAGVMYKKRAAIMRRLSERFNALGAMGVLYDEYRAFYNRALVSLCVSAAGDVAQRVFETAAMGCVILSDPCADFDRLGFVEGEHYLPFSSPDEALRQMDYLVHDAPVERVYELAENAYQWAQPHTWDARAEQLITVMQQKGALEPCV